MRGSATAIGFTPSVQLEKDAPDLIVTTPGGKLAIVECTTHISDFASKVGKLVDRRGALSKQLSASGHPGQVATVLICKLPRDQIAAQTDELRTHNIILRAGDDLLRGFDNVRIHSLGRQEYFGWHFSNILTGTFHGSLEVKNNLSRNYSG